MRIRPGFLADALLMLLIGWALLTGATPDDPPITGGLLAGVAALLIAVSKLAPVFKGAGEGVAVRDLIVEMQAEARADRSVLRESTDRIARTFEKIDDTLRAVEKAMDSNAMSIEMALEGVKANSNVLAAGIRDEIKRGKP